MRKLLAIMTVVFASLAALTANAEEPSTKTYVGGRSDLVMACGVNGACFSLTDSTSLADISLKDVTGADVGAHYRFKNGAVSTGSGVFCGSASLPVPTTGATNLYILVMPVSGCAEGVAGFATLTTS